MHINTKSHTLDMVYIALCAVLIAVCSWISIPSAIPFTLQTFAVFLTMFLLGGRRGFTAIIVYILLGLIGIPVFSGFLGGIGVLFSNTGGYIIGFIFSGLLLWATEKLHRNNAVIRVLVSILALSICYAFGTLWFFILYTQKTGPIQLMTVMGWCVFPFIIPDLIKLALAMLLGKRLSKIIMK